MQLFYKVILGVLLATFSASALAQSSAPPAIPAPALPNTNAPTAALSQPSLSAREIARRSLPSVVMLAFETERADAIKYGSGFFVTSDIIATNFHVVENTLEGYVKIVGQEPIYPILGLVGIDRDHDLALVKVKGIRGTPLPLGNSASVAIGDELFAVGNPKGLEGTFSQGIVSSIRRDGKDSVIQITAAISHGSSGGPILNTQGEVIGIAFSGLNSGQALNFAIPSFYLKPLITNPKPLLSLQIGSRARRASGSEESTIAATEDDVSSAEEMPQPRSATPRMSNESLAIKRSAPARRKKGLTQLGLMVNGTKQENFGSDECRFRMPFDSMPIVDSNRDGIADNLAIEINCPGRNILLAFSAERMGTALTQGVYENAVHVSATGGIRRPGFAFVRQLPGGKIVNCDSSSTGRFQIFEVVFEIMDNKFYLDSLRANFDVVCHDFEGSGTQKIKGILYYNTLSK
ncbi:MAG: serine protease [Acidobacteria bacterium]|nr:serine protease [Acidobacteriota bacterium]